MRTTPVFLAVWLAAAAVPARQSAAPAALDVLPRAGQAAGWTPSGPPERYERESLYGYIDGGAELVLPYGFEEAAVGRYVAAAGGGREVTVEVYRTATPLDAFGLFSVQRDGTEDVSSGIASPHWLGPSQACLAKGRFYVSLVGFGTSSADLESLLRIVEARVPGPPAAGLDPHFDALPADGRRPRSERFLKGEVAARAETQLLSEPFWGFGSGTTAVAARYGDGTARLVVISLSGDPAGLDVAVRRMFESNLEGTAEAGGRITARGATGLSFAFERRGRIAYLAWGKGALAGELLDRAIR